MAGDLRRTEAQQGDLLRGKGIPKTSMPERELEKEEVSP